MAMKLKKIILIRHAKVVIDGSHWLNSQELKEWIVAYNLAPIEHSVREEQLIEELKEADFVLTSALRRTIDTVELLDGEINLSSMVFNELDTPEYNILWLKLRPSSWLTLFRVLQMLGIKTKNSFLQKSKERAKKGADILESKLNGNNTVALVGHGGLNHFLAKELKRRGFRLTQSHRKNKNLGFRVFEKSFS
jgi:broad specificity phosphatase PhoE